VTLPPPNSASPPPSPAARSPRAREGPRASFPATEEEGAGADADADDAGESEDEDAEDENAAFLALSLGDEATSFALVALPPQRARSGSEGGGHGGGEGGDEGGEGDNEDEDEEDEDEEEAALDILLLGRCGLAGGTAPASASGARRLCLADGVYAGAVPGPAALTAAAARLARAPAPTRAHAPTLAPQPRAAAGAAAAATAGAGAASHLSLGALSAGGVGSTQDLTMLAAVSLPFPVELARPPARL
jgi:hypothetical protein